jgi:hypothetical protein
MGEGAENKASRLGGTGKGVIYNTIKVIEY